VSINLCFYTKTKIPRYIAFPFQTPTNWTYEIYEAFSPEDRINILQSKMKDNPWLDEDLVRECKKMLSDPDLELSYI
jgi:hypothetical protein